MRRLQGKQALTEAKRFALEASRLRGLLSVVLYGSYARGDFGRKSDVDLLLIFDTKANARRSERRVNIMTARSNVLMRPVTETLEELEAKPQEYVRTAMAEGYVLYMREGGFNLRKATAMLGLRPQYLITYELHTLSKSDKNRVNYALFGRGNYKGVARRLGLTKIAAATLLVPLEHLAEITQFFESHKIPFRHMRIWKEQD